MDDALRRRLVGAAVLLAAAFGVAALLPDADVAPGTAHGAGHVVTYDLRTGQPIDAPPMPVAREVPKAQALAPAAVAVTEEPESDPDPQPEAVKPAPSPPPAPAAQAPLPHPTLKVDESLGRTENSWFVQIGSFESQNNARTVMQKLYGANLPALIQTVPVGRKLWYRVRVGPYGSEGAAQKALATVKQKGFASAKLVRPDSVPAAGRN